MLVLITENLIACTKTKEGDTHKKRNLIESRIRRSIKTETKAADDDTATILKMLFIHCG